MSGSRGRKAVFIDRDGTINCEKEYLFRTEECSFISGAPEAIRLLNKAGFKVIVVTNQSGIGRGFFTEKDVRKLHQFMDEKLAGFGAFIDAWYLCPHHPDHGIGEFKRHCDCRKPQPGMLFEAAGDLGVDLAASYIVGDKLADIKAGIAAGCLPILVRTGYGASVEPMAPAGVPVFDDLLDAAQFISCLAKQVG